MNSMQNCPLPLLSVIASYLPIRDLANFGTTAKDLNEGVKYYEGFLLNSPLTLEHYERHSDLYKRCYKVLPPIKRAPPRSLLIKFKPMKLDALENIKALVFSGRVFPVLELNEENNPRGADYDQIRPEHMTAPIMQFMDETQRPGLALCIQVNGNEPRVMTIFQKFREQSIWIAKGGPYFARGGGFIDGGIIEERFRQLQTLISEGRVTVTRKDPLSREEANYVITLAPGEES